MIMKVFFLVPGTGADANGGISIVYDHANRLGQQGHDVCLWHVACLPMTSRNQRPRVL